MMYAGEVDPGSKGAAPSLGHPAEFADGYLENRESDKQ